MNTRILLLTLFLSVIPLAVFAQNIPELLLDEPHFIFSLPDGTKFTTETPMSIILRSMGEEGLEIVEENDKGSLSMVYFRWDGLEIRNFRNGRSAGLVTITTPLIVSDSNIRIGMDYDEVLALTGIELSSGRYKHESQLFLEGPIAWEDDFLGGNVIYLIEYLFDQETWELVRIQIAAARQ